jgi:hypothetical protein
MTNISMRMPVDLLETLKKVAPLKEMTGYQSLIKYYIGQGLIRDNHLVSKIQAEEEADSASMSFEEIIAAFDMVEKRKEKKEKFVKALQSKRKKPADSKVAKA